MTNARTLGLAVALLLGVTTIADAQQTKAPTQQQNKTPMQQQAKAPTPLQTFEKWATYTYNNAGAKVCYAATQPSDMQPAGVNRDPVFMFITNRPKEGVKHEISVITGYPYKEGSKTTVKIGDATFSMYTKDQGAWVENPAEESRFINTMKSGATMVITGTSRRGTVTTDTYSLKGISAALKRIDGECQ